MSLKARYNIEKLKTKNISKEQSLELYEKMDIFANFNEARFADWCKYGYNGIVDNYVKAKIGAKLFKVLEETCLLREYLLFKHLDKECHCDLVVPTHESSITFKFDVDFSKIKKDNKAKLQDVRTMVYDLLPTNYLNYVIVD